MSAILESTAFSTVRVVHTFRGNTAVYWTVKDAAFNNLPVALEWAHTPAGTWHRVDDAVIVADGQAIDPKQRLYGKDLDLFYRVRMEQAPGKFLYSFPMQIGYDYPKQTWLKFKEILRLAELSYGKNNPLAIDVCLLKRRIRGRRCMACRDRGSEYAVSTECTVCFGTQVVGGYYPAYSLRMLEGKKTRKYSYYNEMSGMDMESRRSGSVVAYPVPIDERDIIVNKATGERYFVAALKDSGIANHVQIGNLTVVQQFDFDVVAPDHILYQVPLDGCAGTAWLEDDPCAASPPEEAPCDYGQEEERPVFPDVPIVPEPVPDPEKDGAELVWPGY